MNIELIITRHPGLVEYLREIGVEAPVVSHVTSPDQIRGKIVAGVLPLHLAAECAAVVEIPLALTPADRAAGDLPVERVREIAGSPRIYTVRGVDAQYPRELDKEVWP